MSEKILAQNQITVKQCLDHITYFSSLSDKIRSELTTFATIKTIPGNSILMYENDEVENIYFLCSGMLKVYKVDRFDHETFLYHLMPGTVISELTDFSYDTVRCFSNIEAVEESAILVIQKVKLLNFSKAYPEMAHQLLIAFSQKSRLMQCLVNKELVYDGTAKVAYTLLYENEIFNRMKKQEIAYMLNIQPATLSRILKKFERKGVIALKAHAIDVLQHDELEKVIA